MVAPRHGPPPTGQHLPAADRVTLWLGVGANGLIGLAVAVTGVGFMVGSGGSGPVIVVGLVFLAYGILVGMVAFSMLRLRARSARAALHSLWLPGLIALGALIGAFDDGFHPGMLLTAAVLGALILVCGWLISRAVKVVRGVRR